MIPPTPKRGLHGGGHGTHSTLDPTHSDGLVNVEWENEVEHSVRIAKIALNHLTSRHPDLFQSKDVAWYVATDEEMPK